MSDHTQSGMRKNPAPHQRQHGLCLAADTEPEREPLKKSPPIHESLGADSLTNELQPQLHAASHHATSGEETTNQNRLLNVHEVADLLQVSVSWVYGRTRRRTIERLPAYRLGKYWRFDKTEVLDWVARHKPDREPA